MSYLLDRVAIGNLMTQSELERFVKKGYFLKDLQSTIVWEYMQSDFLVTFVFIACFYYSYKIQEAYFKNETPEMEGCVENHTIQVIFPGVESLRKDTAKPNLMNMTHAQIAELTLSQLTMRQIHKNFSDKFGDIHRMYFGRDYEHRHNDSIQFL
jgi:hypothetical protein